MTQPTPASTPAHPSPAKAALAERLADLPLHLLDDVGEPVEHTVDAFFVELRELRKLRNHL
jgi:hypothetical protein